MKTFTVPTAATASPANQAIFAQLEQGLGMVPNLYATLAWSEHALGNYPALQNGKASLNAKEREVINLVVSQVNDCAYCLVAHTMLGGMVGFTPAQVVEIRKGGAAYLQPPRRGRERTGVDGADKGFHQGHSVHSGVIGAALPGNFAMIGFPQITGRMQ